MDRGRVMVPFGTEITEKEQKGTLVMMDAFDSFTIHDLEKIADFAEKRNFDTVVLYPHNEKTLKTMGIRSGLPFSKRLDQIRDVLETLEPTIPFQIEPMEGKRGKYTPIEYALRFLMDKYDGPLFLYIHDAYANQLATFPVFEEWIKKIRLVIVPLYQVTPNPKLLQHQNRWEYYK